MDALEYYRRLFRYDRWANRLTLEVLSSRDAPAGDPVGRALKLLAHIVGAEWIWLERLNLPTEGVAVWPELSCDQCGRQLEMLGNVWEGYLAGLAATDFDKTIEYTNSKGQPWRSRVEDVLMHVVMHSAYHRGQIALEMRAAGLNPAYTDFIQAVRTEAIG
jgi:uncharacterized damage-inducible protein DinB